MYRLVLKQVAQAHCSPVLTLLKWFMPDMVKMALPLLVTDLKCRTSTMRGEHQLIIQNRAVVLGNCLPGGKILKSQMKLTNRVKCFALLCSLSPQGFLFFSSPGKISLCSCFGQ